MLLQEDRRTSCTAHGRFRTRSEERTSMFMEYGADAVERIRDGFRISGRNMYVRPGEME